MKNSSNNNLSSFRFRAAIRSASRSARRNAFRRNLPVAISRNGQVIFIYKNNREVVVSSLAKRKPKS